MSNAPKSDSTDDSRPLFSLLLPSRGRIPSLQTFFASLARTTCHPERLEVILVVDEDDVESQRFADDYIPLQKVVVPSGLTMGRLNNAAYERSTGRFVMLVNDDLSAHTLSWDEIVLAELERYPDDVALIHVNDELFRARLCTFPLVSRRACAAIGLCDPDYRRYRIDDDIYATYCLLALLGFPRISYLPHVVFEHHNFQTHVAAGAAAFHSADNKAYVLDPRHAAIDKATFESRAEQRQRDAIRLAELIDPYIDDVRRQQFRDALQRGANNRPIRLRDFVRRVQPPRESTSVAVYLHVSEETAAASERLREWLDSAGSKVRTTGYLLAVDNEPLRSRAIRINQMLQQTREDYALFMDFEMTPEPGWLDRWLSAFDGQTGLVASNFRGPAGEVISCGIEWSGLVGDPFRWREGAETRRTEKAVAMSAFMIDVHACGHVRFDETFNGIRLDLDFCCKVWEQGFGVVSANFLPMAKLESSGLLNLIPGDSPDSPAFAARWISSGRWTRLEEGIWTDYQLSAPARTK